MKNLSLSIPKPCSEKWENFTPAANGGFCGSCSKIVVDFTNMSDDAIIDFFSKKPAHACGRFRPGQLKTYAATTPLKISPGFTLLKAGLLSLLFLLVSKQTSAQNTTPKTKTEVIDQSKHRTNKYVNTVTEQTLTGIVRSEDNEPMPGVSINLKGSAIETAADADGRFEFPQKVKKGDVIVFKFIGFTSQEYTVTEQTRKQIEIQMMCDITMLGELAVDEVYTTNESGFRRWWLKVRNVF
jgi:hypothetical protein